MSDAKGNKDVKKGFFAKLMDTLDQKMKAAASSGCGCCSSPDTKQADKKKCC